MSSVPADAESPEAATFNDGSVIAGRYRLERVLGTGGMGIVYLAEHLLLGEKVALKFLQGRYSENPEVRARFVREARSQFRIVSPYVVRVLDVGETDSGSTFIAMEHAAGSSLRALMDRGPLPITTACTVIRQVCQGLAVAHALGIVHRDIKPSNIIVATADGEVATKIIDFGIAQLEEEAPNVTRLTATTTVIGTPAYMAPEQLRATRDTDDRSDLWSVAVTLYELLTGRVPYDSESPADLILLQHDGPPPLASSIRADIPDALARIVNACFVFDSSAREANVTTLAEALTPFTGDTHSSAALPPPVGRDAQVRKNVTFRRRKVRDTGGRTAFELHEPVRSGGTAILPQSATTSRRHRVDPAASDPSRKRMVLASGIGLVLGALIFALALGARPSPRAAERAAASTTMTAPPRPEPAPVVVSEPLPIPGVVSALPPGVPSAPPREVPMRTTIPPRPVVTTAAKEIVNPYAIRR